MAFYGTMLRATLGFLRSVIEAPALAAPPSQLARAPEHPPKPAA